MDHSHAGHQHAHSHGHHHAIDMKQVNNAFIIGIILNLLFVVIEAIVGFNVGSLSLLSDAGHNLADVASLGMSLFAFRLAKVKSNEKFTYGYKKTTVLVALLNAAVLFLSIGAISYEAVRRLFNPEPLPGKVISLVALIGIFINAITALLFLKSKDRDLNIKSAFLHLMADAVVSAGLVIGGIVIYFTGFYWIDPALSLLIGAIILISTWQLLKNSLRLSLDAVPEGISLRHVQAVINKVHGVRDFHHIHIWAISTTENALTAHVLVAKDSDMNTVERIKQEIKHELFHLNIQHATLEIETENAQCEESHPQEKV
ncbi:MAG: cation transporter [Bacteroidetes bacterium]|nr:MAG: cation transporter [Bacteroidota bacterium]